MAVPGKIGARKEVIGVGEKSHIVYRGEDGRLISKEQAATMDKRDYTRERMPNPGRGDTGRKK